MVFSDKYFLITFNREFKKLEIKSYPKEKKVDRDQLSREILKQKLWIGASLIVDGKFLFEF